ncbi:MAG TPA: aconitate hydratase, partial [bacterium]|nr:aconitate hydratase [bacterium]
IDKIRCEKAVSYCDHTSLGFKGESSDDHLFLQTIASKYGAYFSKGGNGVCHQIHYERFGEPGKTMLGSDSHTPTAGGIGMMGIGVGGLDVAVALGGGAFYLRVPKVIKINLTGALKSGVSAKDVILEVLRKISVKGGVGCILEYSGEGVKTLTVPQRATITNMGAETGATTSLFPSDEITKQFLKLQNRVECWRQLDADADAVYFKTIDIDLSSLKPQIAMPGSPDNVKYIEEVEGTELNQIFIGSCTNGSVYDLKIASEILNGKKISKNIDLIVSPGSKQVFQTLMNDGSIKKILDAGGRIADPGCNACIGVGFVPGFKHLSLRTVNRNWFGRGGSKDCLIALCSAETAAASALEGKIADPRKYLKKDLKLNINEFVNDDCLIVKPFEDKREVLRGPNIAPLKKNTPLPDVLKGKALIKVGDGISTDDILPAGPLTQHLRSNLPKISEFVFYYIDSTFPARCKENNGGFILGGENYGQGSSREHAALAPNELGIKAVLAKSFARIHRSNLINTGIIPVICNTDLIDRDDELEIDASKLLDLSDITIKNLTKNFLVIKGKHDLTSRESEMIKAGGVLRFATR